MRAREEVEDVLDFAAQGLNQSEIATRTGFHGSLSADG
jgi:hypothetical protein